MISRVFGAIVPVFLFLAVPLSADEQVRDTSKPTNLFSRLDTNLEWTDTKGGATLFGYRGTFNWAIDQDNLALVEVPILNNDQTDKTGVGDIRVRYFTVPVRRPEETVNAIGGSVDVFAPTGKFEDGLGSSQWIIAPGLLMGMSLGETISAFPIVSYTYSSKPSTDLIPSDQKKETHGFSAQAITVFPISQGFFLQLTPKFSVPDFDDGSKNGFSLEAFSAYSLGGNWEAGGFFSRDFQSESTTLRATLSYFLPS